jgi:hypothetical protein
MKQILLLIITAIVCRPALAQNIGIGTTSPQGKLQVNHRSSSAAPGLLLLDSSTNFAGTLNFQHLNNTRKITLQGFTVSNFSNGQYLDVKSDSQYIATFKGDGFLGVRNTDPSYPLDVVGDINTTGALRLNGNPGVQGQVLTSSGTSDPVWKNQALTNNVRFAVNFNHVITTGHSVAPFTTIYNLSTADVTIGANSITINKSGLYHFDLYFRVILQDGDQRCYINYYFSPSSVLPDLLRDERMPLEDPVSLFTRKNCHFTLDAYISAPTTFSLGGYHVLAASSSGDVIGKMYVHLISE